MVHISKPPILIPLVQHQALMIKSGVLDSLVELLKIPNPKIKLRTLEALYNFSGRFREWEWLCTNRFTEDYHPDLVKAKLFEVIPQLVADPDLDVQTKGFEGRNVLLKLIFLAMESIQLFSQHMDLLIAAGLLAKLSSALTSKNVKLQNQALEIVSKCPLDKLTDVWPLPSWHFDWLMSRKLLRVFFHCFHRVARSPPVYWIGSSQKWKASVVVCFESIG